MRTDVFVNSLIKANSVKNVIWRRFGVEGKYCVRVFPCVLKKILRNHRQFSQLLISFVEDINHRRFFSELDANVSGNLESGTSQGVSGDDIPFVEPKPDSGIELTLYRVLARYLQHVLAMPLMALVLLAPVFPLQFPLLNLSPRD